MLQALREGLETFANTVDGVDNLHFIAVPDNVGYPYQVFYGIGKDRSSMDGNVWRHESQVQFNFRDIERDNIETTVKNFMDTFENAISSLTVTGWTVFSIQSVPTRDMQLFGDVWDDVLDYQIVLLKSK